MKTRNLERNPAVAVLVADESDAYRWLAVRGQAEFVDEGADEHIDKLSKKYMNVDSYPFRNPAEQRVIVKVTPEHRTLPPR